MPCIQHLTLVVIACESCETLIPKKLPLHEQKQGTWYNYLPPSWFPLPPTSPTVVNLTLGQRKIFTELHPSAPSELLIPELYWY